MLTCRYQTTRWKSLDLSDSFFESLRADYPDFDTWQEKHANDQIWVVQGDAGIDALLFCKTELAGVDCIPQLPCEKRFKIATLKVRQEGCGLAKEAFEIIAIEAAQIDPDEIYCTIYPYHRQLYKMFVQRGFRFRAVMQNGEHVLVFKMA